MMIDLLIAGDFRKLRVFWASNRPGMPQAESDEEAEIAMHQARTMVTLVPNSLRMWSHRWLKERNLPSMLPPHLVPEAERTPVQEVRTVGISVGVMSADLRPAAEQIQRAMSAKVLDAMSGGAVPSNEKLRTILAEAQDNETRKLFGKGE